jgi:hypothetical protein
MPINEKPEDLSEIKKAGLEFRKEMRELGDTMAVEEFEMMSKTLSKDGTEIFYDGDTGMPNELTPLQQREIDRNATAQEKAENNPEIQ